MLRNSFVSVSYGGKLGPEPTTAGPSNIILPAGEHDLDGLLAAMGTGLFITGFVGGNSNDATGDFSLGIKGLWVENGRPVDAVAEMNLSGNHLTFWQRVVEVADDPWIYSTTRTPSLLIDKVTVA